MQLSTTSRWAIDDVRSHPHGNGRRIITMFTAILNPWASIRTGNSPLDQAIICLLRVHLLLPEHCLRGASSANHLLEGRFEHLDHSPGDRCNIETNSDIISLGPRWMAHQPRFSRSLNAGLLDRPNCTRRATKFIRPSPLHFDNCERGQIRCDEVKFTNATTPIAVKNHKSSSLVVQRNSTLSEHPTTMSRQQRPPPCPMKGP